MIRWTKADEQSQNKNKCTFVCMCIKKTSNIR